MFKNARSGRLLAVIALVAVLAGCDPSEPPPSPITKFGYLEIVPPSTLHLPGSINSVEFASGGRVQLHPTCNIDRSDIWKEIEKATADDNNTQQWIIERKEVSEAKAKAFASEVGGMRIREVFASIMNPRILALTDETLLRMQRDMLKGACQEAVELNIMNGANVCQARAVLEADIEYTFSYEEGVSAKLQSDLTSQIAANLDLGTSEIGKNYIAGKKLFFAVRLAPYGIVINTPDAQPSQCL